MSAEIENNKYDEYRLVPQYARYDLPFRLVTYMIYSGLLRINALECLADSKMENIHRYEDYLYVIPGQVTFKFSFQLFQKAMGA